MLDLFDAGFLNRWARRVLLTAAFGWIVFLAANALLESPPFVVDQVLLYSSTLHPAGAIHRVEATYPLAGP